jgi:N-acetylglucosaminyldiphosphoundecaprenol N-acetyl-beta-D-mannosaminyltransferase
MHVRQLVIKLIGEIKGELMQANVSTNYQAINLFGIKIHALTMDELINICGEHISMRDSLLLGVINVAKLVNSRKNDELHRSLTEADIVLADGLPIKWLSRMMGSPLPERVAGIDIMYRLLKEANEKNYRVYFLGAKSKVLQTLIKNVQKDYPGIPVAGYRDGYFDKDEEQDVAKNIRDSRADILFVGISSPKKENFLKNWQKFIDVPICHGVGGSFDILAGVTNRAPVWMQNYGLEWLYRLIQEPRRMWRRYLFTNLIFTKLSFEAILRARFGKLIHRSTNMTAYKTKKQNK